MDTVRAAAKVLLGSMLAVAGCKGGIPGLSSLPGGGGGGGGKAAVPEVEDALPEPGKPAFCKGFKATRSYSLSGAESELEGKHRWNEQTLLNLQRVACANKKDAGKAIELRAQWLAELKLTDEDVADSTALMDEDKYAEKKEVAPAPLATMSPIDQVAFLAQHYERDADGAFMEQAWWLDSFPEGPSEMARLQFVAVCTHAVMETEEPLTRATMWAVCSGDAHSLSRADLDGELTAANAEPAVRFHQRVRLARALAEVAKIDDEFAKLVKSDPGWKKLIVDVPAQARIEWQKTVAGAPKAFAAAIAIEDAARAGTRSALEGCHEKLWPAWQAYVGKQNLQASLDVGADLVREPLGYELAFALAVCHKDDENSSILAGVLGDALNHTADWQGERIAIYQGVVRALPTIKLDKKGTKIDLKQLPRFHGVQVAAMVPHRASYKGMVRGQIEKVTPGGESVTVSFKGTTYKVPVCDHWVETNKVDHIDDEGKLVYRTTCTSTVYKAQTETPRPVKIPAFLATGIEVGRNGAFLTLESGNNVPAVPLEISEGAEKAKKTLYVLGIKKG